MVQVPETRISGYGSSRVRARQLLIVVCWTYSKLNTNGIITCITASADFLKVPSTPHGPNPSIMSRVSRKGTVSGVGKLFDWSKA